MKTISICQAFFMQVLLLNEAHFNALLSHIQTIHRKSKKKQMFQNISYKEKKLFKISGYDLIN